MSKQKAKTTKQKQGPRCRPELHSNLQCPNCDMIGITYATTGISLCGFCQQPLKIDGKTNNNITRGAL